ncbi:MAG TPA: hypothetical protein VGG33_15810 [Polyangia bacterium]
MWFAAGGLKWRGFTSVLLGACLAGAACGGGGSAPADAGMNAETGSANSGGRSGSGGGAGAATGGASGQGGSSAPDASVSGGAGGAGRGGSGGSPVGGPDAGEEAAPRPEAGAPDVPASDTGGCNVCAVWGQPTTLGRVSAAGLDALSGMAASWRNQGIVYVHNDRDRPVIHALNEMAGLVATLTLTGATVRDVEDMAVSRCPGGTCLYLADIGNNVNPREEFAIYRAIEPALVAASMPSQQALPAERFAFRYADGAHNAESLIVDPNGGGVYIVTKVNAGMPSAAYRLMTFVAGQVNVAMKLADLPVPRANDTPATSGTAHPCGAGFLLRTGNTLYDFRIAPGAPFEQAFRATPIAIPVATEQQGEAVTYRADGRAIYTTSEGASPPLNRTLCQ